MVKQLMGFLSDWIGIDFEHGLKMAVIVVESVCSFFGNGLLS